MPAWKDKNHAHNLAQILKYGDLGLTGPQDLSGYACLAEQESSLPCAAVGTLIQYQPQSCDLYTESSIRHVY